MLDKRRMKMQKMSSHQLLSLGKGADQLKGTEKRIEKRKKILNNQPLLQNLLWLLLKILEKFQVLAMMIP